MSEPIYLEQDATLSDCGRYRYRLVRSWDHSLPRVAFVMLNPSTADATKLDPTLRRCLRYAQDWGFGSMVIGNLFALRSTDPRALRREADPVGPENNDALANIAMESKLMVYGWGNHGWILGRDRAVIHRLAWHRDVRALRLTKEGRPSHPLYLPGDLTPTPYVEMAHA